MFSLWYFRRPPWDSGITPPELLEYLESRPAAGRAIDLGCGTGTNVITMARMGWQVTGVDFVPKAIDLAREKARKAGVNVDLRVGDVTRLDGINGPFDFALDLGCFHGLTESERSAYLKQLDRLLAPDGTWFMYTFLRSAQDNSGAGLSSHDLLQIQERFKLRSRSDGFDRGDPGSSSLRDLAKSCESFGR